jgi:RIO-like serine/threonine protein kinase
VTAISEGSLTLLAVLATTQGQRVSVLFIMHRAQLSRGRVFVHLKRLKTAKLITVDCSAKPHAYRLTAEGAVLLSREQLRRKQRTYAYAK